MSKFKSKKNRSQKSKHNSPHKSQNSRPQRSGSKDFAGGGSFKPQVVSGMIKRHADGFGFLVVDKNEIEDVFVPASGMNTAMTNDKVTVRVEQERDGRYRGEIIRINERSQKKVAGRYFDLNSEYGYVKDEGKGWGQDLKIPKHLTKSAKAGQLVAAMVKKFPDEGEFLGEVVEIIGDPQSALNDIKRVIINQNIPDQFSAATLEEAEKFDTNPSEADFRGRRDLRKLDLITIDGATAKDFDDAVYTEMKDNGFHLIVAIADVSHYVQPGTAIDKDAYERGTSVYFPNFVVPMLPEALSNGLCSLNPHVPRLALVADMHFDFTGEMMNSEFYEAVIESKARVTYGEAQQLIDDENSMPKLNHVKKTILTCKDLAKLLMALRFKNGSLDLEVPETELVIDGAGEPIDVIRSERLFAHRLIEELMLAANVAVAKFLTNKEIPAIYRVHETPDPMKISILQKHMEQFGSTTKINQNAALQKQLTKALQEFENKTEASVLHILTLRSMSQAKYTIENVGHFGLGFHDYTHFTSPIRRYPDLIVHRLVKSQIGVPGYRLIAEDDLATAGTWLSACEQRSAKSERQIQSIKKSRFMKKHLGEEYHGIISSITKFGMFVLLKAFNVDGLVRIEGLGAGKWVYDEENLRLTNKGSGFSYKLGDPIRVSVTAVDVENGQINFDRVTDDARAEEADEERSIDMGSVKSHLTKQKYAIEKKKKPSKGPQRDERRHGASDRRGERSDNNRNERTDNSRAERSFERPKAQPERQQQPVYNFSPRYSNDQQQEKPQTPGQQVIKPRYSSLADYLDKNAGKNQGKRDEKTSAKKPTAKRSFGTTSDREDSKKRGPSKNDSGGFRKARSKKSSRKNKSR